MDSRAGRFQQSAGDGLLFWSPASKTGVTKLPTARPEVTGRRTATASTTPATSATSIDPLSMLSKQQLAELLGVDPWTVDRWRRPSEATYDPSFPEPIWISNATPRWRRSEIEHWLATRQRGGLSPSWTANPKTTAGRAAKARKDKVQRRKKASN
jgi:predicted DNA-binding transcriptional regulator AlpA